MMYDVIKVGQSAYYEEVAINSNDELYAYMRKNGYSVLMKSNILKRNPGKYVGYRAINQLRHDFTLIVDPNNRI